MGWLDNHQERLNHGAQAVILHRRAPAPDTRSKQTRSVCLLFRYVLGQPTNLATNSASVPPTEGPDLGLEPQ